MRRYFETEGDWKRGRRLFANRACEACHGKGISGAPPLRGTGQRFSTSRLASAVWRHGPEMLAAMEERSIQWPALSEREVLDLIAHLNHE